MTNHAVTHSPVGRTRQKRGWARRIGTVAAVLAVAVAGLVVSRPPLAHAALHNIFPADADGTPQGVFYADSALFVTLTSDLTGGVVCIVSESVTSPSAADCQSGFVWGKPHTYIGMGTLLGYPLHAPPLPVGKWRLLATDTAGKNGNELSEVFEVRPCRGTCDTSAAESQLAPWKAKAKTANDTVETLDYIAAADKAMSLYNNLSGVLTDVVKGGGPIGVMMGIGTAMIEGQFANAWDTHKNMAMSILRPLYATSYRMWGDISRDPPRDDYDVPTQPVFGTVPTLAATDFEPALTAAELDVMNVYVQLVRDATAYGDASRFANERYMGAIADSEYLAAATQAKAASTFTFELNQRLRALKRIQPQVSAMAWAQQPAVADSLLGAPAGQSANDFFQSLITEAQAAFAGGVSDDDRASLKACEFYVTQPVADCPITDEMIDYSVALWQQPGYVAGWRAFDVEQTPASTINAYTAALDEIIETYDLFGRWMGLKQGEAQAKAPEWQPNRQPTASFTVSRAVGAAPLVVTFTSTATDPDGDALTLTWDIAGAKTVTGETSVTHAFTSPGVYWVSLVAADPEGLWHQAVKKVEVYPGGGTGGTEPAGNQAPLAAFTPTNPVLGPPDAEPPYEQTFSAIGDDPDNPLSFDPDGDTLSYTWYFGDGTSSTGAEVTRQFDEGYVTSVLLLVSDGWKTAQASGEVTANWADGSSPAGNHAPTVTLVADPDSGAPPLQVLFTATGTDEDDDPLTYQWDFGDGQADGNKQVAAHTYTQPGIYEAVVTVSDGQATARATKTVVVEAAPPPLAAAYVVGKVYDAASALGGAQILDTGVSSWSGYPVTNIITPGNSDWYTANGVTDEQEIIVKLGGGGRDLVGAVDIVGRNATTSVKEFSVALTQGANPFGGYVTVLDHRQLDRSGDAQSFSFAPQTATFLKLTVHDNYGGNYLRLAKFAVPTLGRDGGIVSLDTGDPATVVSSSTPYSDAYDAVKMLAPEGYWSSVNGVVTDQQAVVQLGGEGPHTVGSVVMRGSTSARSAKDFEIWASDTDLADTSFQMIGSGTLAKNATLQRFSVTDSAAKYVKLVLKNNHGATDYLQLNELQVLTTAGLNVADGTGVGAQIVDSSGSFRNWPAENAISHGASGGWLAPAGAVTDQFVTVLLRSGEQYVIDRVTVDPGGYRPRDVEVQVSDSGTDFTTVATQRLLNVDQEHTISFAPISARFVRLVLRDGYHGTYLGVSRFRVFTTERGSGVAVPFSDLSTGTPTNWNWTFGDGGTSTDQHPVHTFANPGTYPITLTVTDADGGTDTTSGSYTVPSMPGIAIETATDTVDEGSQVPLTATSSGSPIVQWEWDLDYATPNTTGNAVTARFPDNGTYTVRVRGLTPDWLWTDWATRPFTVLNVPPTTEAGTDLATLVTDPVTPANTKVWDPGADTLTCTWEWGDGTSDTIENCSGTAVRIPHTYTSAGTFTAALTVTDDDGGSTSDTMTVIVSKRPTFLYIVSAAATGTDLVATVRLLDAPTGAALQGQSVTVAADGTSITSTTDSDGYADVTLAGASAAETITVSFGGSAKYLASSLKRRVRAPKADIVFLVDESGSMASKQAAIRANLQTIIRGIGTSLAFRVGVVGYAATDRPPSGFGHVHTPLTDDLPQFYQGTSELRSTYGNANAYDAIVVGSGFTLPDNDPTQDLVATDDMVFRAGAASCLVLISDATASEIPGAAPKTTRAHAEQALGARGSILFAVTNRDQATKDAYGPGPGLAGQTGGDWWNVEEFAKDPAPVLSALIGKCVTKATTPDLSVTIDAPTTVSGNASFTTTVTAANNAAIDTPHVTVTATLPPNLTFETASDGGVFDSHTRVVTWPTVDFLDARAQRSFTITSHRDTSGDAPGDYDYTITASVDYNRSLGAESDTDNNLATRVVTVQVPEPDPVGDVGIGIDLAQVAAPEAGELFTYPIAVTHTGTAPATGVVVLHRVPNRLAIEGIVIPQGWTNENGPDLVGAHPDGKTAGTWVHLTAETLGGAPNPIIVTARLLPLAQPAVVDDTGALDDRLPALAAVPADALNLTACITAEAGDERCADAALSVKDIVANVTVRLFGGITHLIVSLDTTAVLDELPITLTWRPGTANGENDGQANDLPQAVVVEYLEPGKNYVIPWPGGVVGDDGVASGWPGWRAITAQDRTADGRLLDPVTHEVLTGQQLAEKVRGDLILDLKLLNAAWRDPSTVTFSVNPSTDLVVTYREALREPGGTDPPTDPPTDPAGEGPSSLDVPAAPDATGTDGVDSSTSPLPNIEVQGAQESAAEPAEDVSTVDVLSLATTGVRDIVGLVVGGLFLVLGGMVLVLRDRRRTHRRS